MVLIPSNAKILRNNNNNNNKVLYNLYLHTVCTVKNVRISDKTT